MSESLSITLAFDPDLIDDPESHEGIADLFRESALAALANRRASP